MYIEFVAVGVTRVIIKNPTFCPHNAIVCLLWFSKRTAIFPCIAPADGFL